MALTFLARLSNYRKLNRTKLPISADSLEENRLWRQGLVSGNWFGIWKVLAMVSISIMRIGMIAVQTQHWEEGGGRGEGEERKDGERKGKKERAER